MEVEKVLRTPTRPLRANEPFLRNATGRVLPEWKFYTIGIGLLEIDPGNRSENIDAPWRDAEVEPRLGVEGDCDPPTTRYLISEASSAANSSIQSLSPGARSNHLVVKLSQFEDRRDLLFGSSGLPECAIEGPVVFRHPTLAPHHTRRTKHFTSDYELSRRMLECDLRKCSSRCFRQEHAAANAAA